jgi:hypothetical protein
MKKIITRFAVVFGAIIIGLTLVYLLAFLGEKSSGPAENFLRTLNQSVFDFEEEFILKNKSQTRAQRLEWLKPSIRNRDSLVNPSQFLLGAYDNQVDISLQPIIELEDSLRTTFPLIHIYTAWGSKKEQTFPIEKVRSISALGSIPVITWEPWLNDFTNGENARIPAGQDPNKGGLKRIALGNYDDYLRQWAQDAKNSGITILLRMGHEMNDPYRYPWGPQNNKPEDFIAAWKHVVTIFKQANANNIVWVWAPHLAYGSLDSFYPGADWVDWISTGTLNYGTVAPWSQWWSFEDIFGKHYPELSAYNKPILIAEFGSLAVGGDRASWYTQALKSFKTKFPLVKSLIIFHHGNDNSTTYQSLDWRIMQDQPVLDSIRPLIQNLQK